MTLQSNLREWRKFRKLTQERVGELMGVSHTTIGRWEKDMALATDDLERLAEIYGCSLTQLTAPPTESRLVERLDRTQEIVAKMDEADLERWLAIGESLSKR